ncbi:endolytic transglycosylase MltG [Bacillus suaedaesalsae]|uniref:Endolytic murein transglycosylase n=1 Tax=Bacillus suaedaesalsae TaxID=2810349 RepID=A0ABS2DMG7_9BACI|nr:endolytic transglycosylase MltG [Bacillus suaedaesalsae]MBM6619684.1 endolytic transglycosylase MltG [Bacillus suaedaesalsae]
MTSIGSDSNKEEFKEKLLEKHKEAKLVRRIVLISTIVIFLIIGSVITFGYLYIKSALEPVDPKDKKPIEVTIPIGSSSRKIASILEENKVIKDDKVFRYYVKFKNESGFMAGDYKLNQSMTFDEIIASLKSGRILQEAVFSLTLPEGKQLVEITKILSEKTGYTEEELMTQLNDRKFLEDLMAKYPTVLTDEIFQEGIRYPLEGYLYPATYSYYKEKPSIEELITPMLEKTEEIFLVYQEEMIEKDMSVHQLLTFASLIEEEATQKTDREKIASVFYNRLDQGMKLQTDPTVLYSLGEHKDRVLYDDLEVESPYNTYVITGIPVGPIANAGEMSIKATINPGETDYLYFLAAKDGEVHYAKTLDEHNRLKAKYITNQD